jgi:hypothetical protein
VQHLLHRVKQVVEQVLHHPQIKLRKLSWMRVLISVNSEL